MVKTGNKEVDFKYVLESFDKDFQLFVKKFRQFSKDHNINQSKIFDLEVSLEELIVNSFTHGQSDGGVEVLAVIKDGELVVRVEDSAPPFNLLREAPQPPQGDLVDRKVGGLGIHLVKNLNDRVEYSGSQSGNKITLFKKL